MSSVRLYSLTILKNLLGIVLQIFPVLAEFECNITSDWLNHKVAFKFTKAWGKNNNNKTHKECS